MFLRRFISLLIGLLLLASSVPMHASADGCAMGSGSIGDACCCCDGGEASGFSDCAASLGAVRECCDSDASAALPASSPLGRHAGCVHASAALHVIASLFGHLPAMRRAPATAAIPDVIAFQRRHTYLLVSSLQI